MINSIWNTNTTVLVNLRTFPVDQFSISCGLWLQKKIFHSNWPAVLFFFNRFWLLELQILTRFHANTLKTIKAASDHSERTEASPRGVLIERCSEKCSKFTEEHPCRSALSISPTKIYLFKLNNKSIRKRCKISSKLTLKTP